MVKVEIKRSNIVSLDTMETRLAPNPVEGVKIDDTIYRPSDYIIELPANLNVTSEYSATDTHAVNGIAVATAANQKQPWMFQDFETPLSANDVGDKTIPQFDIAGESTQDGTPTSTVPIDIENTGDTLKLTSCGKNILPTPTWTTQTQRGITVTYDPETQIYTFNGTHDGTLSFSSMIYTGVIQQASNKTFSLSVKYISGSVESPARAPVLFLGDSDDGATLSNWKYVNLLNSNNSNNNLTSTKKYIYKAWFYAANGQTFTNYKIKCQFEENATATEYEPYKSGAQTITLTDVNGNSHDLRKFDIVRKHEDGKWYFDSNSNLVSFDGTENWNTCSSYKGFSISKADKKVELDGQGLCNYYLRVVGISTTGVRFGDNNNYLYFIQLYTDTMTLDAWKAQLAAWNTAGTPLTVLYQTANTTSYELNSATQDLLNSITLKYPNATLYFTNDTVPTMKGQYRLDTKKYIDNKFAELQAAITALGNS